MPPPPSQNISHEAEESRQELWRPNPSRDARKRRRRFAFERPTDADKEDPVAIFWQKEFRELELCELSANYSKIVPMTVNILRSEYGESPRRWWGDLSASETRALYHSLLPTIMLLENEDELKDLPLKNRAYIASMARYAARLYARERCRLPARLGATLYDGFRHVLRYGRWSWTGMSVDEIWLKYELELRSERGMLDPSYMVDSDERAANEHADPDERTCVSVTRKEKAEQLKEKRLYKALYQRIITKSCRTNPFFDRITDVPTPNLPDIEDRY